MYGGSGISSTEEVSVEDAMVASAGGEFCFTVEERGGVKEIEDRSAALTTRRP
jgi:hypothetical protein